MAKTKAFKIPAKLGAVADLLFTTREQRLALDTQVEGLKKTERLLKDHLIDTLPKSEAEGIVGKLIRATIIRKNVAQVKDWGAFYAHVRKTGEFDLMQKRVGDVAVKERWEAGKEVPGVEAFTVVDVSLTKL